MTFRPRILARFVVSISSWFLSWLLSWSSCVSSSLFSASVSSFCRPWSFLQCSLLVCGWHETIQDGQATRISCLGVWELVSSCSQKCKLNIKTQDLVTYQHHQRSWAKNYFATERSQIFVVLLKNLPKNFWEAFRSSAPLRSTPPPLCERKISARVPTEHLLRRTESWAQKIPNP